MNQYCTLLCVVFLVSLSAHVTHPMTEYEFRRFIYVITGFFGHTVVNFNGTGTKNSSVTNTFRPIEELNALNGSCGSLFYFNFTGANGNKTYHLIVRVAYENQIANVYHRRFNNNITVPTDAEEFKEFFRTLPATDLMRKDNKCHLKFDIKIAGGNEFNGSAYNCRHKEQILQSCHNLFLESPEMTMNMTLIERYPIPPSWNAIPC